MSNLKFFAMSGRFVFNISRIRRERHVARMGNENCSYDFPRNIGTEYTTCGFIHSWEDNIKMDVKETEREIVSCQ